MRRVLVDDADEAWERVTDVEAVRIDWMSGWQVAVAVMEFGREDPLESELRRRIPAALRSEVVDDLADQTRGYVGG